MARDVYVKKENLEDVISGIEKKVPKAVPSVILKKDVIWEGIGNIQDQALELSNDIENYDEVTIFMDNYDDVHIASNTYPVVATPFSVRSQWVYRAMTMCSSVQVTFNGGKSAVIADAFNVSGERPRLTRIVGTKYTYEKNIPNASPTAKGKAKLYDSLGNNEDGSINQKAITDAIHSMGSGIGTWTANTEYPEGVSVTYKHCLYKCTATHTSGTTFSDTYWYKVGVSNEGDIFTGPIGINRSGSDLIPIYLGAGETEKGTVPDSEKTLGVHFQDGHEDSIKANRYGSVVCNVGTDGTVKTSLLAYENVASSTDSSEISISVDTEGNATTSAPTTPDDSEGTQIVTADFLKDSLATKILKPWTANTQYKLNTTVVNDNIIYKCTTAHTSGIEFDDTEEENWTAVGGTAEELTEAEVNALIDNFDPYNTSSVQFTDWATNTEYNIGDYAIHSYQIYKCNTAHTSTTWSADIANWTLMTGIEVWATNTPYVAGQIIYNNTKLYRVTTTFTSGATFDDTNLEFLLPKASDTQLGGIKVGQSLDIDDDGVLDYVAYSNASAHNSVYRGKDLTSYMNSGGMSAAIRASTFDNIYPGDYVIKSVTVDGTTYSNVKWIVMDLDYFYYTGDTGDGLRQHHVVLMPETSLANYVRMNSTDITTGGYLASEMWTTTIPKFVTGVENAFGSDHVLSHRELLENWTTVKVNIPNESMIYGYVAYGDASVDVGNSVAQFSVYRHCSSLRCKGRKWGWLRSVANETSFCAFSRWGHVQRYAASNANENGGIYPYFLYW